jgi:hypothetical protein
VRLFVTRGAASCPSPWWQKFLAEGRWGSLGPVHEIVYEMPSSRSRHPSQALIFIIIARSLVCLRRSCFRGQPLAGSSAPL